MDKKSNLNKFLTFLENDFYRSLKVMIPTMGLFFLAHIVATLLAIRQFNSFMNNLSKKLQMDVTTLPGAEVGSCSLIRILNSSQVMSIMICSFVAIGLYTLVLWNREWRGSSKTSYTLLTLPLKKIYILISKNLTILIFLGINLLLQYLTLFIDKLLISTMVPKNLIMNVSVFEVITGIGIGEINYGNAELKAFLSLDIITIILNIGLAISVIIFLGLIVLLFRSFKVKGAVLGVAIFSAYTFTYIFGAGFLKLYFYEGVYFRIFLPLIISILGFIWSKHLLEKKVSV